MIYIYICLCISCGEVCRVLLHAQRPHQVIKKKLVSKALDMMKKMSEAEERAIEAEEEESKVPPHPERFLMSEAPLCVFL